MNIIVSRKSEIANSHMETIDIIGTIDPNKCYKICNKNLIEIKNDNKINIKYLSNETNQYLPKSKPNHVSIDNIDNRWNDKKQKTCPNSNILGNNGILELNEISLGIPIAETSINNLSFYSASLLKINDNIQFDIDTTLPITIMNIGKNYVKHFLLVNDKGGGCYLEYHSTPHFHMPLNNESCGYLILGKIENNICYLSAFKIPFGYAIYTPPNVIHCDGYLIGEYLVVYTIAETYSTVLIKNDDNPVNVYIY